MDKIVFLDRDGVINTEPGDELYVMKWESFKFLPGAIEAIKKLTDAGYKVFVISNQAGISKGLFSQHDLDDITANMLSEVEKSGSRIDGVFYCPHQSQDYCDCRKPKTGLFEKAVKSVSYDPSQTFFIGDTQRDVKAGKTAGYKTILVLTGKASLQDADAWIDKPDFVKKDLLEAATWIIEKYL